VLAYHLARRQSDIRFLQAESTPPGDHSPTTQSPTSHHIVLPEDEHGRILKIRKATFPNPSTAKSTQRFGFLSTFCNPSKLGTKAE